MAYKWNTFLSIIFCLSIGLYYLLKTKTSWAIYLFFLWSFITGLLITIYPNELYSYLGEINNENLKGIVNFSLLTTIIPMIFIFSIPDKYLNKFIELFCLFGIVSAVITIYKYITIGGSSYIFGFMTNTSVEATFLAILSPFVFYNRELFTYLNKKVTNAFKIIIIIAVFLTTSSTGIGGLIFSISFYLLITGKIKYLILPVIATILSFYHYGSMLLSSTGRSEVWSLQIDKWLNNPTIIDKGEQFFEMLTGTGFGTYAGFGPWYQKIFQTHSDGVMRLFPNLHSDVLQLGFEMGAVGIILALIIFIQIMLKSINKPWLLTAIVTYVFASCINMPSRYIPISMIGFLILRLSYKK